MVRRYPPGSIFPRKTVNKQERASLDVIEVRTSQIPNAGQGVFATQLIEENTTLAPYRGEVLTKQQMDARYGDEGGAYIAEVRRPDGSIMYVDAQSTAPGRSNWTRYINDPHNTDLKPNVELDVDGYFYSLCDIPVGCELLFDYGTTYWPDEDVAIIERIKSATKCNCGVKGGRK